MPSLEETTVGRKNGNSRKERGKQQVQAPFVLRPDLRSLHTPHAGEH